MKSKIITFFLAVIFIFNSLISAQYKEENDGYFKNPKLTNTGVIATNNFGSSIYSIQNNKLSEIISSPGVGNYFSISKDKSKLGVKIISEDGLQSPAIIELSDYTKVFLHEPVQQCGQISFSENGNVAFSVGTKLIVREGKNQKEFELNTYSNMAPISPNGKMAVYNDLSDQIWIINLENGQQEKISDEKLGYYKPEWSNDSKSILYSALSESIYIHEIDSKKTIYIDEGSEPHWSPSGKSIVYYKKEIVGQEIINSDLFIASSDGTNIFKLTDTKNIFEMDPVFRENDSEVIYHTYGAREIFATEIQNPNKLSNQKILFVGKDIDIRPSSLSASYNIESVLDIPYVHQVYDTPDWHNGHWSCAPTAAMMVIAYYHALPKWETWCSWPSPGHSSAYGRYVAERYTYYQNDYRFTAGDAGGYPTQGGYGYMWSSGSPHTKMKDYYLKHRINSQQDENPTYSEAINEIDQNYPYTMCVMLTTSGHLIIANGLQMERTLIFNDPYGNKNTTGYPSYDGKNVKYDWPGYNNGYQNLNGVAWCISNHRTEAAQEDTLIDDLHFDNGFYLHNKGLASMDMWLDYSQGYNGHFWYKKTTSNFPVDTCFATWTPTLSKSGIYEVSAYISFSNAEAAFYKIVHNNEIDTITINQNTQTEEWVSLGEYEFQSGIGDYVQLGDASVIPNQEIVFDAIKFELVDSITTSIKSYTNIIPEELHLFQNYPNPFNPSTRIDYHLPEKSFVTIKVYDMLGKQIKTIDEGEKQAGDYSASFNAEKLSSGVYIVRLQTNKKALTRKMILMK